MNKTSSNLRGVAYLSLAMFILSLQGVAVKWIGAFLTIGSGLYVLYRDRTQPVEVHGNVALAEGE